MSRTVQTILATALFSLSIAAEATATESAVTDGANAAPSVVTRPQEQDTTLKIDVNEIEARLFEQIGQTGTGRRYAPLAIKAQERLVSYRQVIIAEPKNRLLPQMLRTVELLTNAAIAEAKTIQLQDKLDSLFKMRIVTQAEIRSIQNQIIQSEQSNTARLKGSLAANEQLLGEERKRAEEYSQLMLKEKQRAADYSQLAEEERLRAKAAERIADSLQVEAKKRQDEVRNRLNALQSKLIQVTQDARGIILSMSDILFAINKADLTPDLQQNLAKIAGILTVYKELQIVVEGHTDNTGSADHNQKLSNTRANNVRDYLMKMGLEPTRLKAVGYGMTKPISPNTTPEERQKNRRVDLVISDSQLEGK